jgi:small conductance mechanosensitive channel
MDDLLRIFNDLKSVIGGAALLAVALIVVSVTHKRLQNSSREAVGRKFRNQLVMAGVAVAVLLTVISFAPIEPQLRGNLLSLIGIVLSATIGLSSTTLMGNAMAGIMLKSVNHFRSGDFIRVNDHFGRVSERGLFHTEIQTPDRDLITLPNLQLATSAVRVIRPSGTVISSTVSLGYDIHHSRIEELLLQAGDKIGLADPFVQVLELGDFSITYRLAGLLEDANKILVYQSRLKVAMLDALHNGGVEIVSPQFTNHRIYKPGDEFISPPEKPSAQTTPDAPRVDVVFDKAEAAATTEQEQSQLGQLTNSLEDKIKDLKKTRDPAVRNRLEMEIHQQTKEKESLSKNLEQRQEQVDDDGGE